MLHGHGSNEKDLFSVAKHIPGNSFVVSVRAPFTLLGKSERSVTGNSKDEKLSSLILRRRQIPVLNFGFSMHIRAGTAWILQIPCRHFSLESSQSQESGLLQASASIPPQETSTHPSIMSDIELDLSSCSDESSVDSAITDVEARKIARREKNQAKREEKRAKRKEILKDLPKEERIAKREQWKAQRVARKAKRVEKRKAKKAAAAGTD